MFGIEEWNVGKEANSLNSSLFGREYTPSEKQKRKKQKKEKPSPNPGYPKADLKRKLQEDEMNDVTPKKMNKNKVKNKSIIPKDKVRNTISDLDIVSVITPIIKQKEKRKPKSKSLASTVKTPDQDSSISRTSFTETSLDETPKSKEGRKTKKRKNKVTSESTSGKKVTVEMETSQPKKAKVEEKHVNVHSPQTDSTMTRKQRRNKRKRIRNKNKFKQFEEFKKESGDKSTIQTVKSSLKENGDSSQHSTFTNVIQKDKNKKGHVKTHVKNNDGVNKRTDCEPVEEKRKLPPVKLNKKKNKKNAEKDISQDASILGSQSKNNKNFDRLKLKEILSSSEKLMKTLSDEVEKKTARKIVFASNKSVEKENESKNSIPMESLQKTYTPKKQDANSKADSKKVSQSAKNDSNAKGDFKRNKQQKQEKGDKLAEKQSGKKKRKSEEGKTFTEKMSDHLSAARFRFINEQLYTTTGDEAVELFAEDQDAFKVYHRGYQGQVEKWPVDPLSLIANRLRNKHKAKQTIIADMGCGNARLSQMMKGFKVHSFDLVALNKWVTACNMSEVPLKDNTVDVVVFCLSLMGTNLVDYLTEANRILKPGGSMKIAEVESRFQKVGGFVSKVEQLGFEIVTKDLANKMFYLFDFKKVKTVAQSKTCPSISLDPCLYKRR